MKHCAFGYVDKDGNYCPLRFKEMYIMCVCVCVCVCAVSYTHLDVYKRQYVEY